MPDWATQGLNSPAGKLTQALMNDPEKAKDGTDAGFEAAWLERVESLLRLGGNGRRETLAILAFNLIWFYYRDRLAGWSARARLGRRRVAREEDDH